MTNHPNRNWRARWPEEAAGFVRDTRAKLGMTQQQLADATDYTKRAVEDWEQGRRVPHPSLRGLLLGLVNESGNNT